MKYYVRHTERYTESPVEMFYDSIDDLKARYSTYAEEVERQVKDLKSTGDYVNFVYDSYIELYIELIG